MSHTSKTKAVPVKDIAALQAAVTELQQKGIHCDLKTDVQPRMYYANQHGKCPFVVCMPGKYDVGFDQSADGTYEAVFDNFLGDISNHVGAGHSCPMPNSEEGRHQHAIGLLLQTYAKHAAMNAAAAAGHMVENCFVDEQGLVQLTLACH